MGSSKGKGGAAASHSSVGDRGMSISGYEVHERHRLALANLTLTKQPFKTIKLFILATAQYTKQWLLYVLTKGGWLAVLSVLIAASGVFLMTVNGPHSKHAQEFVQYSKFVLWWVGLGVASSIGLGSGLHTFVLYLGPHIALFTIKAVQCGRVDLKSALYDTIQLKKGPSWLEMTCSEFGPPLYEAIPGSMVRVPLRTLLPYVQLEAVLWGFGTALGELPPYFISRAACLSGSKLKAMEDLNAASSTEDGFASSTLKEIKRWLFSHSKNLNFISILILASVPNPLFDLAGIMCGQFGIPFWKFFLATLIGKAIIKVHIQTIFIITICNNQLLELVEKKLFWLLGSIPTLSSMLPKIVSKLQELQNKYLSGSVQLHASPNSKDRVWKLSFGFIWNTLVWLMLMNFFAKIVTAIAQKYLQQQLDFAIARKQSSKFKRARAKK